MEKDKENTIMDTLKEANNDIRMDSLFNTLYVYINKAGNLVYKDNEKNEQEITDGLVGTLICVTKALKEFNFKTKAFVMSTNEVSNDNGLVQNRIIEGSDVMPMHEMKDKFPNAKQETMLSVHSEQFPDSVIKISLSGYVLSPDNPNSFYTFLRQIKKDNKQAAESVVEIGSSERVYEGKTSRYFSFTETGSTSPEDMDKVAKKAVYLRKQRDSMQAKLQSERSV